MNNKNHIWSIEVHLNNNRQWRHADMSDGCGYILTCSQIDQINLTDRVGTYCQHQKSRASGILENPAASVITMTIYLTTVDISPLRKAFRNHAGQMT